MLGTDYDQRFGAGFLNRPAHPVETFIQPVAQDGIVAVGTPEDVAKVERSWTGRYLAPMLERAKELRKKAG